MSSSRGSSSRVGGLLVLRSLRLQPYEPLREVLNRDLTLKTVFLLAVASAKQVGELHSLPHGYVIQSVEQSLFLLYSWVVAKTQNPSVYDSRFEEFEIPSLKDFTGEDPDEMLLCPVWAVQRYLKHMQHQRPACNRLFVSTGQVEKEVSKNTISLWLYEVMKKAYQVFRREWRSSLSQITQSQSYSPHYALQKEFCSGTGVEGWYLEESGHLLFLLFEREHS